MPKNKPEDTAAVHVRISGRVQGVGFRYFAEATALELQLRGWVRNLPNGDVEAQAEGRRASLEEWIEQLRRGPGLARVDTLSVDWQPPFGAFDSFSIKS